MTLRLRRPKLLVSSVELSSAKGPGWKLANMFSRLFHHPEGYPGLQQNIHLPQLYLRSWGQDASVCHATDPLEVPVWCSSSWKPPTFTWEAGGAFTCCHLPQSIQLVHTMPLGPKEISYSHSHAILEHRLPPFSHFPVWKMLDEITKVCTDCARSHIMGGKWCSEVLLWSGLAIAGEYAVSKCFL